MLNGKKNRFYLWIAALCVACCAVPLLGIAIGSAALAGLAIYTEKAAVLVLVSALAWLVYKYFVRKKAGSCDLDCRCKPSKLP